MSSLADMFRKLSNEDVAALASDAFQSRPDLELEGRWIVTASNFGQYSKEIMPVAPV